MTKGKQKLIQNISNKIFCDRVKSGQVYDANLESERVRSMTLRLYRVKNCTALFYNLI